MRKLRVASVFGTRPETIKMAPILRELDRRSDRFESRVILTSQHTTLIEPLLQFFGIHADSDLKILKPGQSLDADEIRAWIKEQVAAYKYPRSIEFVEELPHICQCGAEGVGLFRTEYLFLNRDRLPTEDEQYDEYRQVAAAVAERTTQLFQQVLAGQPALQIDVGQDHVGAPGARG